MRLVQLAYMINAAEERKAGGFESDLNFHALFRKSLFDMGVFTSAANAAAALGKAPGASSGFGGGGAQASAGQAQKTN